MRNSTSMASVLYSLCTSALLLLWSASADPKPPVWPAQFHAVLFQNRTGSKLALLDLWYDWPGGRNFNIIHTQLGPTIYDLELNSGAQYVWFDNRQDCKTIHQPVGILTPDWLANATYLGVETVDNFEVDHWTKGPWPTKDRMFVHYYTDRTTGEPVYWQFFDHAKFHVLKFEVNQTLTEAKWQEPARCHQQTLAVPALPTLLDDWSSPLQNMQHQLHRLQQ